MEPIGTITMYYPFLSNETREVIEGLVEDALNYYDFVQQLVEVSIEYPMYSDLAFFALDQSLSYPRTWKKMHSRCVESAVTKPISFYKLDSYDPLDRNQLNELEASIQHALETKPDDWMLVLIYIAAADMAPEPTRSSYYDSARTLIGGNQDLKRFMLWIYMREGYDRRIQGDVEGAIRALDEAAKIADEYDDVFNVASALVQKANAIKDSDVHRALELHDETYSMLVKRVGEFDAIRMVAFMMALCYETLGEYDLALSLLFKNFEVGSKVSDDVQTTPAGIISRIYCALEMPEQALEWLRAKAKLNILDDSMLHSKASIALILKGQIDDAAKHLAMAHKSAVEGGDDQVMGDYLYARGLYEMAIDDLTIAEETLEQALKLADPQFQIAVGLCLISLTHLEIKRASETSTSRMDSRSSGPWMMKLENHAKEKDYPGVLMQHALLKASYQTQVGEPEMARLTLENALTISDSPGTKTLRRKIERKLEELDSIEQEQT